MLAERMSLIVTLENTRSAAAELFFFFPMWKPSTCKCSGDVVLHLNVHKESRQSERHVALAAQADVMEACRAWRKPWWIENKAVGPLIQKMAKTQLANCLWFWMTQWCFWIMYIRWRMKQSTWGCFFFFFIGPWPDWMASSGMILCPKNLPFSSWTTILREAISGSRI